MTIALSGSLDSAFREATSELASWLEEEHKLSSSDVAVVLGTSVQYSIAVVADRNVGVVAKIPKRILALLAHPSAQK